MRANSVREMCEMTGDGPKVIHITKAMFPLGKTVIVETMIDRHSGWDFDAPMEIMTPFRKFMPTGSISHTAVESAIENLIIDLDCGRTPESETHFNIECENEVRELFSKVRSGHLRKRYAYYRTAVQVNQWTPDESYAGLQFTITQVR